MANNPPPADHPFTKACNTIAIPNVMGEATHLTTLYDALFRTPTVLATARAVVLGAQPPPIPMLAIRAQANTAVVLHGFTVFCPPLQQQAGLHPATGATIAFLGEPTTAGQLPPVVKIPQEAFADEVTWPTAAQATIMAIAGTPNDLLPPEPIHKVQISRMIPLAPTLVQFFITNANQPL